MTDEPESKILTDRQKLAAAFMIAHFIHVGKPEYDTRSLEEWGFAWADKIFARKEKK